MSFTTSQANRLQPSNGNKSPLFALLFFGVLCQAAPVFANGPVQQRFDFGVVSYSDLQVTSLGTARPRILSATGSVTDTDLLSLAKRNAEEAMRKTLGRVKLTGSLKLSSHRTWGRGLEKALNSAVYEATHFSDGSVHVRGRLAIEDLLSHPKSQPDVITKDGIVHLTLDAPVSPALAVVLLLPNGDRVVVGPHKGSWTGQSVVWKTGKPGQQIARANIMAGDLGKNGSIRVIKSPDGMNAERLRKAERLMVWLPPRRQKP